MSSNPNFWAEAENAQKVSKLRAELSDLINNYQTIEVSVEDIKVLFELACEEKSENALIDVIKEIDTLTPTLDSLELMRMLDQAHDSSNAIVEINSGAGGTESQDWAEMLLRMYLRWAEQKHFKSEIISLNPGEEAGVKNVCLMIEGNNAFGYLRSERGVHRLVRISPFDSNARRHTSFASVSVVPDIEQDIQIEVREEDLRIDTYRASGAGGQHINKTDSAVRLTHLPSGIVVACQSQRSQHKNKDTAMKLLKAKLFEIEEEKQRQEIAEIGGERRKIDFGSQIRNYVMQPYQLVKDLRTGEQTANVQSVLDGEIDPFIRAYLLKKEDVSEV